MGTFGDKEMGKWVKTLAICSICNMQSGNMSSFPKTQEMESTNNSCKLSSDLHTYVLVCVDGNMDGQREEGENKF